MSTEMRIATLKATDNIGGIFMASSEFQVLWCRNATSCHEFNAILNK